MAVDDVEVALCMHINFGKLRLSIAGTHRQAISLICMWSLSSPSSFAGLNSDNDTSFKARHLIFDV